MYKQNTLPSHTRSSDDRKVITDKDGLTLMQELAEIRRVREMEIANIKAQLDFLLRNPDAKTRA